LRNTSNIENNNFEVFRRYVNGSLEHERTTNNISDDTKVFALVEKRTGENAVVRYQYDNHLGSACLELDANANIISYEEYHPFGTTSYRAGRSYSETSLKRYKYCGKERDEETGLYYYGARYYAGWLCRFVSVDPYAGKYPAVSPYSYCLNNPINKIDPDGVASQDPPIKFGATIGLRIGLGTSGANFKVTGSAGIQAGGSNFNVTIFASGSVYGGSQLGTQPISRGLQFDLTAGTYATVGTGIGEAHKFYTLNYDTPSPFDNISDVSVSWGQMATYNSAINAQGDGAGVQAEGLFGLRLGNEFSLSYNNDSKSVPTFAGVLGSVLGVKGTDAGWTGGITINVAGMEAGYQNFSGTRLMDYPGNGVGEKYPQTSYQQSLNKASTFINVNGVRVEYFGKAWFQNFIHNFISKESTYDYNYQNQATGSVGN
jgi:RHS repeat-associated protein